MNPKLNACVLIVLTLSLFLCCLAWADEPVLRGRKEFQFAHQFQQERAQTVWPDSLNLRFVGNWPFGRSRAVAYDSVRSLAYCSSGGGVYVLNVSNPSSPAKLSDAIRTRGIVRGLFYQSNRLYIACDVVGLEIWDVSDSFSPTKMGSYNTPGPAVDIEVLGDYAYLAESGGIRVVNVNDPTDPFEEGFCGIGKSNSVAVRGNYACVAQDYSICLIDVRDPEHPTKVGFYDTVVEAEDVTLSDGYAYVANNDAGLIILENTEDTEVKDSFRDAKELPTFYFLSQNYPNPFNDNTQIRYQIPKACHTSLKIFNTLGQEVRTLVDDDQKTSWYVVNWDGRDDRGQEVATGLYFCRLKAGGLEKTIKMGLVK